MKYNSFKESAIITDAQTITFVDYDNWRYGLKNQHKIETDVSEWFTDLKKKGRIRDVFFFGDFSDLPNEERGKLTSITNNLINCPKSSNGKDFTDFTMLHYIYKEFIENSDVIQQFILFSGDAHFKDVASFLKNFKDRIIGIYAVKGTLSAQLAEAASWYVEISPDDVNPNILAKAIINNLKWTKEQVGLIPTFKRTIDVVASQNPLFNHDELNSILSDMITKGFVKQVEKELTDGKNVRALEIDWDNIDFYNYL